MTFPADRRIVTCMGLLDVEVKSRPDGRCLARLAGDYPSLAAVGGAIGDTEDEAVNRLAGTVDALLEPTNGTRQGSPG